MLSIAEVRRIIESANTLDELVEAEDRAKVERFPSGVLHALVRKQLDVLDRRAQGKE